MIALTVCWIVWPTVCEHDTIKFRAPVVSQAVCEQVAPKLVETYNRVAATQEMTVMSWKCVRAEVQA